MTESISGKISRSISAKTSRSKTLVPFIRLTEIVEQKFEFL